MYFIENIPCVRGNDVPAEVQDVPARLQQPHQVGVHGDGVGAGVVPHLAPAQLCQVHPIPRMKLLLWSLLFPGGWGWHSWLLSAGVCHKWVSGGPGGHPYTGPGAPPVPGNRVGNAVSTPLRSAHDTLLRDWHVITSPLHSVIKSIVLCSDYPHSLNQAFIFHEGPRWSTREFTKKRSLSCKSWYETTV